MNDEYTRTQVRLSDGRQLLYYDEKPCHGRDEYPDTRELPRERLAAEMRYDVTRGEWIAVAAARQSRPVNPGTAQCPLCPSVPGAPTEIPAPGYEVAVFENRFPSFGGDPAGEAVDDRLTPRRPAVGRCEVVCFTSDHDTSFAGLTPRRVRLVIDALADRTAALSACNDVEQVFCFENRGEAIGVTLHHPHGQIYGYPFVPPIARQMLTAAADYRSRHGGDLHTDVLAAERDAGIRVVSANTHWTAFVPQAARWPYEVHFYPHVKTADLAELPGEYRETFGPVYLDVLRRFDALFGFPMPYIAGWYTAPVRGDRELGYTHLRLFSTQRAADKLKYLAGSESAMGAFVNDVTPETAARTIRDVTCDT